MLRFSAAAFVLSILGSVGCSEAVPEPPRGGLSITIGSTLDKPAGTQCPSVGHNANIGVPAPTANNPGKRVEDGEGANVYCSVKGGDPFNFYTKISQGTIGFTMTGSAPGQPQGVGTGNIVYADQQLPTMDNPDKPCAVTTIQAATGRIYASFDCPQIKAENYYCAASGVFVFENCEE